MPTGSGPGSSGNAVDDLLFHPEDLTLTAGGTNSAHGDNSAEGIGDLVFNPDDHTLVRVGSPVSNAKEKLLHYYQSILEALGKIVTGLNPPRFVGLAALFMLIGIISYLAFWDSYRVNARLLLFQRDDLAKVSSDSSLEREVEMLKNPELMELFGGDVYRQITAVRQASGGDRVSAGKTLDLPKAAQTNFRNASALGRWLQKAMSVDSEISNGVAKVSLSLRGDNPDLLQAVMESYVSRYAEHRLMLEAQAARHTALGPRDHRIAGAGTLTGPASEQLQRVELQEHGCELALRLIDRGKGVFSGFVPDAGMAGTPSLSQFQEKIVQLEIKKRALEVQFTPNAREVRAVDLEIQGVKRAMRECLVEHLEFLKKGKEQLLTQHEISGLQKVPIRGHYQNGGKGSESPPSARPESWILIRDGLYMLHDRPRVSGKPLLVRAGSLKRRIVAYLSPVGNNKVVSKTVQTKKFSQTPTRATSGDGADFNRPANTRPEARSGQSTGNAVSNVASEQTSGSRVNKIPKERESNYWECVPASHFGRKSLW